MLSLASKTGALWWCGVSCRQRGGRTPVSRSGEGDRARATLSSTPRRGEQLADHHPLRRLEHGADDLGGSAT